MKLSDRLERWFGRFAIPQLTLVLLTGQVACFVIGHLKPEFLTLLPLVPSLVFRGEIWRLVTFVYFPPDIHPIFAFFAFYLFYLMGTALESEWGEFRYNAYLFIGCVLTVAVAFFTPDVPTTNAFVAGSIFLAFAFLYPNVEFYLFFVLPVKVKYLAGLTWVLYGLSFVFGQWPERTAILASVGNFFLFFGKDIVAHMKGAKHQMEAKTRLIQDLVRSFHTCETCGITEKINSQMDFRVCTDCKPGREYCMSHLHTHTHIAN